MKHVCIPVLLGGDLNCYGMARAFYEARGLRAVAFGRACLGPVRHSRYLSFHVVPELAEPDVCLRVLREFSDKTPGATRLLLGCTDEYARFLLTHQTTLAAQYHLPVPPERAAVCFDKWQFYRHCETRGIPYPPTVALRECPTFAQVKAIGKSLGYPYIIKPSESDVYWHHPFPDMEKVYTAQNADEAAAVIKRIFSAGYPGPLLCQGYIGGGPAHTLTFYFDRKGRCVLRAAARVLLEEYTPRGKGNYAALLSTSPPPIAEPLCAMLTDMGYRGFANFDLRRDQDGRDYVLEMNLRQGRSSYFLTVAGQNPADLLFRDYILEEEIPPLTLSQPALFHTVPRSLLRAYLPSEEDRVETDRLAHAGRAACPLCAPADLRFNVPRLLYVLSHMWREREKFRRYAPRPSI